MKFEIYGADGKQKVRLFDNALIHEQSQLVKLEKEGYTFRIGEDTVTAEGIRVILGRVETPVVSESRVKSKVQFNVYKQDATKIDSVQDDSYLVGWSVCKKARAYDVLETRTKQFDTYSAAEAFLQDKWEKTHNSYFAKGAVSSEATGEILFSIDVQ